MLNARGHRRGSHAVPPWAFFSIGHVLNARGHRRGSHVSTKEGRVYISKCSTPEGIEGGRTAILGCLFSFPCSAQRPRASKGVAPQSPRGCCAALQCSTPEGIEGGRTKPSRRSHESACVLNARGHRRGSHPVRRRCFWRRRSAQRPRASKGVARHGFCQPVYELMCSTPEGIEGGRTLAARGSP